MTDMQFLTTTKLGPHRELTPEGFLLCRDVPVARIGSQIYNKDEVPVDAGPDGNVKIDREENEVFRPETLASLNGKSVVEDHPTDDVDTENWKSLTVGVGMNAHRGTDPDTKDLLLMDLLITTKQGIEAIKRGKEDISLGYDAKYEQIEPGHGRQYDIVCNHIALVDEGRCGPRCHVRDQKPRQSKENSSMATFKQRALDLLRRARDAKSEEELTKLADEMPAEEKVVKDDEGGSHIHLHLPERGNLENAAAVTPAKDDAEDLPEWFKAHVEENRKDFAAVNAKLSEISAKLGEQEVTDAEREEVEEDLEEEAPAEARDKARKAHDSAFLGDSFQRTASLAEIIAPGIAIPTYDSKASPARTLDCICKLRKTALDLAWNSAGTRDIVASVTGGHPLNLGAMKCRDVRTVFNAVGTVASQRNAAQVTKDASESARPDAGISKKITSISDLNRANAEFYSKQR